MLNENETCCGCENCVYIGEGDCLCDVHQTIVLAAWEPTDEFYICEGKDFLER